VILAKEILQSGIGMGVGSVSPVIIMRQLNTYSTNAALSDLHGQSSK
jgi:hypothetical protein